MDLVKALETPEEKRLRRLAKKEAKNKQLMMEYTNDNNPFNDPELDKPFIWSKKYAAAGKPLPSAEEKKKLDKAKFIELQKIRERRKEREKEREARIKETEAKQRADEAGKFKNWVENEEQFLFKQAQLRSEIRMREGRAKPIDWLVAYINASCNEEPLPELVEPYHHLNGLRINDLEDLQEDIKVYKQLDSSKNLDYWKDLEIIVSDELNKLKRHSTSKNDDGVNSEVAKEQNKLLASKNYKQLLELETSIEKKMADRKKAIDISYWENLLAKTRAFMARARLRDRHQELLKIKSKSKTNNAIEEAGPSAPREEVYDDNEDYVDPREIAYDEYRQGCYSPTLLDQKYCDESLIVNPDDDWKSLEIKRKQVINASNTVITQRSTLTAAEEAFEKVAKQGMESNEGVLKMEEIITQDPSIASWSEKYRPRKPRYFNRVHTGFEWNKYNQTHYDIDNPPPKIVQGYKFNIFYPDLIDKSKKPTYTVTPCADNKDFAIIRFSAGPPYEDIAFKIVNREWNYSHKSGFRNQISNGILQLWFHFKRYRYRR